MLDVFGHRMLDNAGDLGLRLADVARLRLDDLRGEYGFLRRELKPGHVAIDVGANVGLFTLLFARQVGRSGKVFAFEPGPKSFEQLRANISANGYRHVVAEHAAVMDYSGEIELFVCRTGESDNRVAGTLADPADRIRTVVRCISLDEYFAAGTRIDFVKIDVQGAEAHVLRGMQRLLADNPQCQIVMEYAPGGITTSGSTPAEFLRQLSWRFRLFNLPEGGEDEPVTEAWLLENIGREGQPQQTNIVLRR